MTPLGNTKQCYGIVAMTLHWAMAGLLAGLVVLGLYMAQLPDVGFDQTKIRLVLLHKELGILALMLVVLRLAWRLGSALPRLVAGLPEWQQVTARFVHLCLYALMLAQPVTGWVMSSAAGIPVSFFGLFYLPDMVRYDEYLFRFLLALHQWLGYTLTLLVALHVGAALEHHFVLRDETLRKMLPARAGAGGLSSHGRARTPPLPSAPSR
ncbi:cytochrome b [Azoarcus sp. DN11]|uniref:cytochrome b n=1 Tax=Azoarcus sp. DN11 TaxID=356837 RepID=UPI000EAD2FA8|nr:cytochrome b [Azoarcus sp. DN11]AYH45683.1 cytochrome B [Azoarcus sp. DN11]